MAKDFRVLKTSARIACDVMLLNLPTSQVLICRMEMTEPPKLEDSIKDIKYRQNVWLETLEKQGLFLSNTQNISRYEILGVCLHKDSPVRKRKVRTEEWET